MKQEIKITLEGTEMSVKHSDGVDINDSAYMLLTAAAATMVKGNASRKVAIRLFDDAYTKASEVLSDVDDLPSE